ncbi:hypothetical protein Ndes2437B_g01903 [Nannochloris sp. 'desiccata']|nr:hypothetical protein KSW81_006930 [Chlorella desiccata (nom. nud.)]
MLLRAPGSMLDIHINEQSPVFGMTLLHFAAEAGCLESIQTLISVERVDASIEDKSDKTPLQLALDNGHTEVAELLRECMERPALATQSPHDEADMV